MASEAENCPIPVVSSSFCFPHSINLEISKTMGGRFVVKDASGKLIFQVTNESLFAFSRKRLILDAAGLPILTLRSKASSMRSRWKVYSGDSIDDKDLIFSARRSSMIQMKTKIHVFLANNKLEDVCDYTMRGTSSTRVYAGDSSTTTIAQMHKKTSAASIFLGKLKFIVTVHPNIDHAFIVALIVILDEINTSYAGGGGGGGG